MSAGGPPVIFLLGANHRTASIELREQLCIGADTLLTLLPEIQKRFGLTEVTALSTCNRFELIGVAPDHARLTHDLYEAFMDLHRRGDTLQKFGEDDIRKAIYVHLKNEAIAHVFKVAASLDSLVLGETQITGQFKDAFALGVNAGTTGPVLSRLSQEALGAAKKVRTQTAIGKKHVSISHAAIDLAKRVFGDLAQKHFLIVGAGEMAMVAAKHSLSYKPKALAVANRTEENARRLCGELRAGEAYGLGELPSLLVRADVVISSTSASGLVIDRDMVARAQSGRRGRPLVLLDIALPRDIDPAAGQLDDVYLFDIDDLNQVVSSNLDERRKAADEAVTIIDNGVAAFRAWESTLAVKPSLALFHNYLNITVQRELAKSMGRDILRQLEPRQQDAIRAMVDAISGSIAADAARAVRNPPPDWYSEHLAEALTLLFQTAGLARDADKREEP